MRTDTQRLEVILNALHGSGDDAFLEAWQAAHTLGMEDRIALDAAIDARRIEVGEPLPPITALDMLVAEMGRIRNVKNHGEAEDDTLDEGQLSDAAVAYLLQEDYRGDMGGGPGHWPFDRDHFHPSPDDRKREVVKGCALALCELERLLRIDADVAERQGALTLGVDLASGPDQCVVDGVLQPQPREFKVGDRVRVRCRTAWDGWYVAMNEMIGKEATVQEVSDGTVRVCNYWMELASLEHVDE